MTASPLRSAGSGPAITGSLYTVDPDRPAPRPAYDGPNGIAAGNSPVWTPDGQLLFVYQTQFAGAGDRGSSWPSQGRTGAGRSTSRFRRGPSSTPRTSRPTSTATRAPGRPGSLSLDAVGPRARVPIPVRGLRGAFRRGLGLGPVSTPPDPDRRATPGQPVGVPAATSRSGRRTASTSRRRSGRGRALRRPGADARRDAAGTDARRPRPRGHGVEPRRALPPGPDPGSSQRADDEPVGHGRGRGRGAVTTLLEVEWPREAGAYGISAADWR